MHWSDTISSSGFLSSRRRVVREVLVNLPIRLLAAAWRFIYNLQSAQIERQALLDLDDRMLADIGMTRGQVNKIVADGRTWRRPRATRTGRAA